MQMSCDGCLDESLQLGRDISDVKSNIDADDELPWPQALEIMR